MTSVLDDLRVVGIGSGPAAEIATMILADYGADVIKVEPEGGDPIREHRAAPMWLRGKRSVTLDLTASRGLSDLHKIVAGADVVVSAFAPGEAARLGVSYEDIKRLNDKVVFCSVTGWGLRGPYAEYPGEEELVAAKSGRMLTLAWIDRRPGPSYEAVRVGTHAAAQSAVTGILAALEVRARSGIGQLVETSLLRGMLPYDFHNLIRQQLLQRHPDKAETELSAGLFALDAQPMLGYQPIMAKDGRWIQFANLLPHLFHSQVAGLGLEEEILKNPRYANSPNGLTPETREEVRNKMLLAAKTKTADEWMAIFRANGNIAAEPVGTAQVALHNADLIANGEVIEIEDPELGTVRQMGPLALLRDTPANITRPAPRIGEHTAEVRGEARRVLDVPAVARPDRSAPLAGVTILEFATIIAAPLGAAYLADLGARVIKIEPAEGGGDPMRGMAGPGLAKYMISSKTTSGKESLCIDLKAPESREVLNALIAKADMIVHNYRQGVPERLGLGYEQAKAIRPDIIWLSVWGYGPDGPSAKRPAAHPIPGGVDGGALMQVGKGFPFTDTDDIDGLREAARRFMRANEGNPDPNTSVAVQTAAMLALHARRRTGKGQQVFLSMLCANAYANADDFVSYAGKAPRPELDEHLMGVSALERLYRAKDDSWVYLDAADDEGWNRLCAALDRAGLCADDRFATRAAREANAEALIAVLEPIFSARHADEWEATLMQRGVSCVRADTYEDVGAFFWQDPHARDNDLSVEAHHKVMGSYRRWGPMVSFSETPGLYRAGVVAGQHTDAILAEVGLAAPEIRRLREAGIVWSDDTPAN